MNDEEQAPCATPQCRQQLPAEDMWLCADGRLRCWECMRAYDLAGPAPVAPVAREVLYGDHIGPDGLIDWESWTAAVDDTGESEREAA